MDDGGVLEEQRHEVGAIEAAAEAAPRVQLGLGDALGASSGSFIARQRVEKRRRPDSGWALVVGQR